MKKKDEILNDDDSLQREFPLLHSISKENPFEVPDGYFDELPSVIMGRCRVEMKKKSIFESLSDSIFNSPFAFPKRVPLQKLAFISSIFAVTAICLICFFVIHTNTTKNLTYQAMIQAIPDSVIVSHLDNNLTNMNADTLAEYALDDNNSAETQNFASLPDTAQNTKNEIIAYLVDHNVSFSDIENNY